MRDVNSAGQQFSFQSLYYEIFTLTRFVDITGKPGFSQILRESKIMVMRVMKTGFTKMLPVSSCMSIYTKRATIACHGILRGQEFSLEHMIDCIIGDDLYLCTCGLE